jgi:hypothetical protein
MNQSATLPTLPTLRRESGDYSWSKPGKVPPADSPTRPGLAALWRAAQIAATKRRRLRTFGYAGHRFGIVYLGDQLCVMDWITCRILVRPPKSLAALDALLKAQRR